MKAKQNFVIHVDKEGNLIPDGKEIVVKVGEELDKLPINSIKTILVNLPDFLDLPKNAKGQIQLSPEDEKKYVYHPPSERILKEETKLVVPEEKYTIESLTVLYNKKGIKALKEIATNEFKLKTETKSYKKLISEILNAQDKKISEES